MFGYFEESLFTISVHPFIIALHTNAINFALEATQRKARTVFLLGSYHNGPHWRKLFSFMFIKFRSHAKNVSFSVVPSFLSTKNLFTLIKLAISGESWDDSGFLFFAPACLAMTHDRHNKDHVLLTHISFLQQSWHFQLPRRTDGKACQERTRPKISLISTKDVKRA